MDNDEPRPIPAGWLEAIEESDADLAAGRLVPLEAVLAELRLLADEVDARLAARPKGTAASHDH